MIRINHLVASIAVAFTSTATLAGAVSVPVHAATPPASPAPVSAGKPVEPPVVPAANAGSSAAQAAPIPAPVAVPAPAPAQPVSNPFPPVTSTQYSPPGDDVAFYGDEAGLQRQLRLLSLRAEIAALKKKLGEDEAGPGATAASPVAVLPPPMVAQGSTDAHDPSASGTVASITLPPPGRTDARSVGGLQLVSVLGVAGDYQAVVSVGAGQMPVRVGAQLSDGWTVVSIGPTSVSLAKGRQRKTLVIGG